MRYARLAAITAATLVSACAHRPPADFAPDPGLVARIRGIRIRAPQSACPGQSFAVTYDAVLDDGSYVAFDTRYDRKHPPRLHVVFLDRDSPDATPLQDGGWSAEPDPVRTVSTGFHISVTLRAKPTVTGTATLVPDYSCIPHQFRFEGPPASEANSGRDGPPVTVRVGIVRSPYYERLLVASVGVGDAPPFFVLADANTIPPSDWLLIESRGGAGGRGVKGQAGRDGTAGQPGCPGGPGGNGGNGGNGGPGGAGGRGGTITVVSPTELPYLAGLVDGRSTGGRGGQGGAGGQGGKGGAGGNGTMQDRGGKCASGTQGADGQVGLIGQEGPGGGPGPRAQTITAPLRELFGYAIPAELQTLLNGGSSRRP